MGTSPIEFRCHHCGRRLRTSRHKIGKQVVCPRCRQKTLVELPNKEPAAHFVDSAAVEAPPIEAPPIETAPIETAPIETVPVETAPLEPTRRHEPIADSPRTLDAAAPPTAAPPTAAPPTAAPPTAAPPSTGAPTEATHSSASAPASTLALSRTTVLALVLLTAILPLAGFAMGWLAGRAVPADSEAAPRQPCLLSGQVLLPTGEADADAVVVLLSDRNTPSSIERFPANLLLPSAQPIEPTDILFKNMRSHDADATRSDSNGRFTVRPPDHGAYYLLVLSTKQNDEPNAIPRADIAQMGRYVDRPADLIRNHRYRWTDLKITGDRLDHQVQLP
jgi:DNA-directed RNA polymerase subunit RPC12/RpoP